jgi:hypothetical protein
LGIVFRDDNDGLGRSQSSRCNYRAAHGVTYEGDLIRPLGLATLYFGYAEYEIDSFLQRLSDAGRIPGTWHSKPIGQKLAQLVKALRTCDTDVQSALASLLTEVNGLLAQRNTLVHGCLLAGGRITLGRSGVEERRTSVEELNSLAEGIFSWKEQLSAFRWKQVEPLLASGLGPEET